MAFDLSSITRGKRLRAPKIVVYGPPKIGKSTFAASAPNAVATNSPIQTNPMHAAQPRTCLPPSALWPTTRTSSTPCSWIRWTG